MSQKLCTLLLGSDLDDKNLNLINAKSYINQEVGSILGESKIMETAPIGFTSDTTFLNQVIIVEVDLSPIKLLKTIKEIEKKMGREYKLPKQGEKYTSRIIDIDILKYDNIIYKSPNLVIPHPQIKTRFFVSELLEDLCINKLK